MQTLPPLTPELKVTDLDRSLAFYVDRLGFAVLFARPEDGFATVALGKAVFMLEELTHLEAEMNFATERNWNTGPLEYPFGRGLNFQIDVEQVEALYERACAAGAPIRLPLEEREYRVEGENVRVRQFLVTDPDGFLLRFSQRVC